VLPGGHLGQQRLAGTGTSYAQDERPIGVDACS